MKATRRIGIVAALAGVSAAPFADGDQAVGLWRNGSNTVHIQAHHCGDSMCGKVVWASDKAIADARKGGTPNLIGMELFHDFKRGSDGKWHGKVFVPDINKTFSGTMVLVDPRTLKGSGCVLGGLICKTKMLVRIQ